MIYLREFLLTLWQLPQTIIAWILFYYYFITSKQMKIERYNNTRVLYTDQLSKGKGISFGRIIMVSYKLLGNEQDKLWTVQHEYGHVKQSRILGPLYLLIIGIPSAIHASMHKQKCNSKNYYHFYTEKWANKLAGLTSATI